MSSDLYAELNDASTTALEIIRRQRAGDVRGIVDLVGTYSDGGKGLILGAMTSVINHALAAFDDLARSHGELLRGDDLLEAIAVGLQPPGAGLAREWEGRIEVQLLGPMAAYDFARANTE
jgi:hypothetical protein